MLSSREVINTELWTEVAVTALISYLVCLLLMDKLGSYRIVTILAACLLLFFEIRLVENHCLAINY